MWLLGHYGFGSGHPHIAVPSGARAKLTQMSDELLKTGDLVGIYIPEGTDNVYEVGAMKGRIAGAVRLLPMPNGRHPEDYVYRDYDQAPDEVPRWPFGWPCQVVLEIDPEAVQTLRTLVELAHPKTTFGVYAAQFLQGPVRLGPEMRQQVNKVMVELFGPPPWADDTTL
jgi:hypothetical protein